MDITLFNTLGREKQAFKPISPGKAGMYTCGPTVYNFQHIGNFRTFMFEDFLKRVLLYNGYEVKHIMNITDVGHLVSDDDEGEDKMETGSAREGKTVWEIAEYYTGFFYDDSKALNIIPPEKYTKATDYITEQIELVKCLEAKGFTYITSDGVYFDTSKINDYGKLIRAGGLDAEGLEEGSRVEVNAEKKNKTDFALWKFSPKGTQRQMEWDAPWGKGFPGWHLECSAMSKKFLGETFDIHCGGIDHIPIHHTNEIAQSEACNEKPFAHYWLHGAFLEEDSGKMSKSKGEFLRVKTLIDKGYSALDYRYLCLGTHYRKRLIFSWELLDSAKITLNRLKQNISRMKIEDKRVENWNMEVLIKEYQENFLKSINDDINMPEALADMWGVVKEDRFSDAVKLNLLYDFDKVLGLDLDKEQILNSGVDIIFTAKDGSQVLVQAKTPFKDKEVFERDVLHLVEERYNAKQNKDFKKADELRKKINEIGQFIIDKKNGIEVINLIDNFIEKKQEDFKRIFLIWEREAKRIPETTKDFKSFFDTLNEQRKEIQEFIFDYLEYKKSIDSNAYVSDKERDIIWKPFEDFRRKLKKTMLKT